MPSLGCVQILCCAQRWVREELHPKACIEFHRNSDSWPPMDEASNTPLLPEPSAAEPNGMYQKHQTEATVV